MSDTFQYFISEMKRVKSLPDKVEALVDMVNSLIVNIARVAEYCDMAIQKVYESVANQANAMSRLEQRMTALEAQLHAVEQPLPVTKAIPPPPPIKATPVPAKTQPYNPREDIMIELKKVFERHRQLAESDT